MRNDFLYASITDAQGTIRSIDVRAGFLFVVLFLPLSMLDKIWVIYGFPARPSKVMTGWIVVDLLIWALAIVALFNCVAAIDDPTRHIRGAAGKGSFYGGDLFNLSSAHIFFNLATQSKRSVGEEKDTLPKNDNELETELVYEKIKLIYIRTIKIKRFTAAARLTVIWLVSSGALAIYTKFIA